MTSDPQTKGLPVWLHIVLAHKVVGKVKDQGGVDQSVNEPLSKESEGEFAVLQPNLVEVGMSHEVLLHFLSGVPVPTELLVLEIEEGVVHDGDRGEGNVVQLVDERLVEDLGAEVGVETEDVLWGDIQNVFVESVQNQYRIPSVSFPAMYEHERLQEFELTDREIG